MNGSRLGAGTAQTASFLQALFGGKPESLFTLIWTKEGEHKKSCWFSDVGPAGAYVDSLSASNVYVGVGLSPSDFGENRRCESRDIAGIVGLWADIDLQSDAHPHDARPKTIEAAMSVLPPEFSPSIVVQTGNGIQCWWLFKEPWIFENGEERQLAATLSSRWQTLLKYNAQMHGWIFERLTGMFPQMSTLMIHVAARARWSPTARRRTKTAAARRRAFAAEFPVRSNLRSCES